MLNKYNRTSMSLAATELKTIYKDSAIFTHEMEFSNIQRVETRFPTLNWILSGYYSGPNSGLPIGKLTVIAGMESVGKTALALDIARSFYQNEGRVLWIDAEGSFDPEYAYNVFQLDTQDTDSIRVAKPEYGEQAFETISKFAENNAADLIVLDSVIAAGTKRIVENTAEKDTVGELARRLNPHLMKMVKYLDRNHIAAVYINQLRENLITMGGMMKAAGKTIPGGNAMKFYPHIILLMKELKEIWINSDTEYVGSEIEIYADKNKTAIPKKVGSLIVIPGEGFSRELDVINLAVQVGICSTKGSWYYYGEDALGNGIKQVYYKLKENPELVEEIWDKTKVLLDPDIYELDAPVDTQGEAEQEEVTEPVKPKKKTKKK